MATENTRKRKKHGGSRKELGIPCVPVTMSTADTELSETSVILLNPRDINRQTKWKLPIINACRRQQCHHKQKAHPGRVGNTGRYFSLDYDTGKWEDEACFPNTGIYNQSVADLYSLITRENSVMLPPLEVSDRVKEKIHDCRKLMEKRYILDDFHRQGKMARFERDEVYIPTVYNEFFKCKQCKKEYVSTMYTDWFSKRNHPTPVCRKCEKSKTTQEFQYCDVLGQRYCAHCVERTNRGFSTKIERDMSDKIFNNGLSDKIIKSCPSLFNRNGVKDLK